MLVVVMKVLLIDNLILKLLLPTFQLDVADVSIECSNPRWSSEPHGNIQSKHRHDKCHDQVVY